MTHWGWYWRVKLRHVSKALTLGLTTLDSFELFKNKTMTGFHVEYYQLKASLMSDHFRVSYGKQKKCPYIIPIEKQQCNYGGFRYFFKCPICQKRMRILYLAKGVFLCRQCLNLGYLTQRLSPSKRYGYMKAKVETRLNPGKEGYYCDKPKWMRISTFERLQGQYFDYERKEEEAMRKELLTYYPTKVDEILMLI